MTSPQIREITVIAKGTACIIHLSTDMKQVERSTHFSVVEQETPKGNNHVTTLLERAATLKSILVISIQKGKPEYESEPMRIMRPLNVLRT